jgi:hypothetical protein
MAKAIGPCDKCGTVNNSNERKTCQGCGATLPFWRNTIANHTPAEEHALSVWSGYCDIVGRQIPYGRS